VALRCHRHRLGTGPQQAYQRTGTGHGDHVGMVALCHESSAAVTPPDLGLPADSLDDLGWWTSNPLDRVLDWRMADLRVRGGSGLGRCTRRLWLQVSEPADATEVSRPLGSHDV
jgi:hypothetical protein